MAPVDMRETKNTIEELIANFLKLDEKKQVIIRAKIHQLLGSRGSSAAAVQQVSEPAAGTILSLLFEQLDSRKRDFIRRRINQLLESQATTSPEVKESPVQDTLSVTKGRTEANQVIALRKSLLGRESNDF
jgi:hypothetical protein